MRLAIGLAFASLVYRAHGEDLLFYDNMTYTEYGEATGKLGLTAKIATDAEWRAMTTADFATYKAIVIPDPNCGDEKRISFLKDTKAAWSPAILGNIILIGTDPTYHAATRPGAVDLIDDAIRFAASGTKGTGLYFSLSCYYDALNISTVDVLSYFGNFVVRGNLSCYNDAHLVASAGGLTTVNDAKLGNWSCSVHEVFIKYPKTGADSFEALAIARNATGDGRETYGDGTTGVPYIIARGATPAGCGNGKFEPEFGEECDSGAGNGAPGNPCSSSCKCLNGIASPGVCLPLALSSSSSTAFTRFTNSSTAFSSTLSSSTIANSALPTITTSSTVPRGSSMVNTDIPAARPTTTCSTSPSFATSSQMWSYPYYSSYPPPPYPPYPPYSPYPPPPYQPYGPYSPLPHPPSSYTSAQSEPDGSDTATIAPPIPSGSDSPTPVCDAYIGIEVIHFIDVEEFYPNGESVTETLTTRTPIMTRPICRTSAPGYPCYACIVGTHAAGDTVTVTRSTWFTLPSSISQTSSTPTITVQICGTCPATTYTTDIPGLTPGGGCEGCAPYDTALHSLTLPSVPSASASGGLDSGSLLVTCTSCPPAPPHTVGPSNQPYKPTSAPPYVTAGGGHNTTGLVAKGIVYLFVWCFIRMLLE